MSFINQKQNGLIIPLFVFGIFIFILVFPVSGDVSSSLISALPQSSDISSNLQVSKEWESFPTSGNTVHTVRWGGYIPFSCPKNDNRVKNTKGDYVSVFASIDQQKKFQTPEEYQEWVMRYPDGRVMSIFDGLPGSVIASKISDDTDGTQTNNEYQLYMWIDPSTTVGIEVWGVVYKGLNDQKDIFDRLGCTPLYAERQSNMEKFAESEVIRLGNLINSRLHGGSDDELEPDSQYDPLISLLASYIPDPWGIYQTSDKDLLIAALQEHDIEPDGATLILQTQLLQWYEQFIMQIDAEIDCGGDFYSATSSWVDLLPVLYGLPDEFSDLVYLPDKVDALKRAAEVGEKSAEILRDYQNEEAFRDIYQNYYNYREGAPVVEDVSVMRNYLEVWPSSIFVKIELSDEEYEDLFQALECRYLCEKKQEAIQKLRNNERKIVAAKIQEFSSDLRKIERTFDRLLEEKR